MDRSVEEHLAVQKSIEDFFNLYFSYVGETEAPRTYHRWSILTSISALLCRRIHFPFGHSVLYPNQFVMLMGTPGARKNTAMGIARKVLERAGFKHFGADRSSKERLLIDLWRSVAPEDDDELLELVMEETVSEQFIAAPEFTDFTGKNNSEMLTMLGNIWDNPPEYKHPKITGKSILVPNPTINILGGNTPEAYNLNMPPEAMGTGFMARLIHVHSDPTGHKITLPKPPLERFRESLDLRFATIKKLKGTVTLGAGTAAVMDRIYREYKDIDDHRFKHYNGRRFTHLIKLAMVIAAARLSLVLQPEDFIAANTILHYTELRMPKALGEFGKARNAGVANTIMEIMIHAKMPVTIRYLWKQVQNDLNRQEELNEIMRNMVTAQKIQLVEAQGKSGYVPKNVYEKKWESDLLWDNLLSTEERA